MDMAKGDGHAAKAFFVERFGMSAYNNWAENDLTSDEEERVNARLKAAREDVT